MHLNFEICGKGGNKPRFKNLMVSITYGITKERYHVGKEGVNIVLKNLTVSITLGITGERYHL